MNAICTIDATKGKFTQKRWNEFCSHVKQNDELIIITINDIDECIAFDKLKDFLKTKEMIEHFENNKDEICAFVCEDVSLIVDVNDVIWWQKQKNGEFARLDKLFSEVKINSTVQKEKQKTTTSTTRNRLIKVAAGVQENAEINELELFEGMQNECVVFINEYFAKMSIRSRFDENKIVKFVVDYQSDDDLYISTNWKTIDELELEGVIITK